MKRGTKFKTKASLSSEAAKTTGGRRRALVSLSGMVYLIVITVNALNATLELGGPRRSSSLIVLVESSTRHSVGDEARLGGKLAQLVSNLTSENSIASRQDRRHKGRDAGNQLLKLLSRPKNLLSSFVPHILAKQLVLKRPNNHMPTSLRRPAPPVAGSRVHLQRPKYPIQQQVRPRFNQQPPMALNSIHLRPMLLPPPPPPLPVAPKQPPKLERPRQIVFVRAFPPTRLLEPQIPLVLDSLLNDYGDEEREEEDDAELGLNQVDQLIKSELETRMNLNEQLVLGRQLELPSSRQVNGSRDPAMDGARTSSDRSLALSPELETTTVWPADQERHSPDELTTAMSLVPADSTESWLPTELPQVAANYANQLEAPLARQLQANLTLGAADLGVRPPVDGVKSPGDLIRSMPVNASSTGQLNRESFLPSALETIVQLRLSNSSANSISVPRIEDGWLQRQKNHKSPASLLSKAAEFADKVQPARLSDETLLVQDPNRQDAGQQQQYRVDFGLARSRNTQLAEDHDEQRNHQVQLAADKADRRPLDRKASTGADGSSIVLDETLRKLRQTRARILELQAKLNATYESERATGGANNTVMLMQDRTSNGQEKGMYDDEVDGDSESAAEDDDPPPSPEPADRWPHEQPVAGRQDKEWWLSTAAPAASTGEPQASQDGGGSVSRGLKLIRQPIRSQQVMNLPMGMYHGNGGPLRAPVRLAASAFGRTASRVAEAARGPSTGKRWSAPGLVVAPDLVRQHQVADTHPTSEPIILTSMITVSQTGEAAFRPTTPLPRQVGAADRTPDQSTGGSQLTRAKSQSSGARFGSQQSGESSIVMLPIGKTLALDPLLTINQQARANQSEARTSKTVIRESLNDNGANQSDRLKSMQMAADSRQPNAESDAELARQLGQQQVRAGQEQPNKLELAQQVARKPTMVVATSTRPANSSSADDQSSNDDDYAKSGLPSGRKLPAVANSTRLSTESSDIAKTPTSADHAIGKDSNRRSTSAATSQHGSLIGHLFSGLVDKLTGQQQQQAESREPGILKGLLPDSSPARLTTERVLQILIGVSCTIVLLCLLVILAATRLQRPKGRALVGCPMSHSSPSAAQLDLWRRFGLAAHDSRFQHNKRILDGTMRNVSLQAKHLQLNGGQQPPKEQASSNGAPLPLFNRSCCHCVNCSESWLFRDSADCQEAGAKLGRRSDPNLCSSGFYHPAPRGKLPFGAASSVNKLLDQADLSANASPNEQAALESLSSDGAKQTCVKSSVDSRVPVGGTRMRMMSAIDERQSSSGSPDLAAEATDCPSCSCKLKHDDTRAHHRQPHSHSTFELADHPGCQLEAHCTCAHDNPFLFDHHQDECRRAAGDSRAAIEQDLSQPAGESELGPLRALNCCHDHHDQEVQGANDADADDDDDDDDCRAESINVAKIVQHQRTTSAKLTCSAQAGSCMDATACCHCSKLRAKPAPSAVVHNNDSKCSKQAAIISLEGVATNNCAKSATRLLAQPEASTQLLNCYNASSKQANGFKRIAQRFEEFSSQQAAGGKREGDNSADYEPSGLCPQHEARQLQAAMRQAGRLSVLTKPLLLAATIPRKLRQTLIGQTKVQR